MDSHLLATGTNTDLYQLTMAQGYWRTGLAERRAVFHLTYRKPPFSGQGVIACGLGSAIEALENWRYTPDHISYLASLNAVNGSKLFDPQFLDWLLLLRWTGHVDAIAEGTWVLPKTPLLRIDAPLVQAQIVETMLLTIVNFQTLIATKAARIITAAAGADVLEFGLRRAQGLDGGLSASRAAFIGGCHATSNVAAGQAFGIPLRGTHAHSWVMAFDDEETAFRSYAHSLPNNVVLLVDTYETIQGIERAIRIGQELAAQGQQLLGIRLDSGDLTALSRHARQRLNDSGLHNTRIVASGDLDEDSIRELRRQGAAIDVYGVGTRLITAYNQPALGGVYKLGAIADAQGVLQPRIKLSDDSIKHSDPGVLSVARVTASGEWLGDVLYDEADGLIVDPQRVQPSWPANRLPDPSVPLQATPILQPIHRQGERVASLLSAPECRSRTLQTLKQIDVLAPPNSSMPIVVLAEPLTQRRAQLVATRQGTTP